MENTSMLKREINLATLCLRLCEEIEEHYRGSGYHLKPMPRDEAFEKEIAIGEDVYCALYVTICGLIDAFHKENDEIVISTYQNEITVVGLEIANESLHDLCSIANDKYHIQRSRLGIALAFLKQEQVKIEQVYREKRDCIGFAFPRSIGSPQFERGSL